MEREVWEDTKDKADSATTRSARVVVQTQERLPVAATTAAEPDEFDPDLEEIDLTDHKMTSIPENLGLCRKLKTLSLRQNKIQDLSPLASLTTLTSLDLYENELDDLGYSLSPLKSLTWLDLSFNGMRKIHGLDDQKNLTELFLIQNKIQKIENLSHLRSLRSLELGSNRIRVIDGLSSLTNLTELWLGRNKIAKIQGLETLVNLRKLSLQSNRIVDIGDGLRRCTNLEELYISHNGIDKISGLETLTSLRVLDLSGNRIKKLENVSHLSKLEELWINNNFIEDFDDLKCVSGLPLQTLYLERNPLQSSPMYKHTILSICKHLTQLDASLLDGD